MKQSAYLLSALSLFTLLNTGLGADIDVVRQRRHSQIVGATTGATTINTWCVATLKQRQ